MLLRLGEGIRLETLLLDHALLGQSGDRVQVLTSRYLESIKRAILDHTRGMHLTGPGSIGSTSPSTRRGARSCPATWR